MRSRFTYVQIDETAEKLKELEEMGYIKESTVLLRPEETFLEAEDKAEELYHRYQVVKSCLLKDNVMEALRTDLDSIKAGDVYIAGDVEDVDKKARNMIIKVYSEAYNR